MNPFRNLLATLWALLGFLCGPLAPVLTGQIISSPVLASSGTSTASGAGTTNITMVTVTLPTNVLAVLNAPAGLGTGPLATGFRIRAWGHVANNANAKSVVIRIGGVQGDSMPITASVGNVWWFDCQVNFRTAGPGAGAQPYFCFGTQGPGTATSVINNPASAATVPIDPTTGIAVALVAAIQTSAADITVDGYVIELTQ